MKLSREVQSLIDEMRQVVSPSLIGATSFLCVVAILSIVIGAVWMSEMMWFSLLPILILWENGVSIEKWVRGKVRWVELEEEIENEISRGRLDESIEETRERYTNVKSALREWTLKKPTIFERIFLKRGQRREDQNESLYRRLTEIRYFESRLESERGKN